MFYPQSPADLFWRVCRSFFCLFVLSAPCAQTARAQMGGVETDLGERGTGGQNVIQGRVFYPSGRMVDKRVKVRLTSISGADMFALTDDNGTFSFRRLAGGSYVLYVDAGKEYLTATERVEIIQPFRRGGAGATYAVQIQLQLKPSGEGGAAVVNAALSGVPKDALSQYEKALKSARSGDHKKAVELFKKAISLHSQFTLAYNEMGVQYFKLGDLDNAAVALQEAIKLSPDGFSARLNYGIVLFYRKEYENSAGQLGLALKQREDSANAHFFRGRSLIKLAQYQEAEKEMRRAVEIGGAEVNEAYRYLGGLYVEMGENARAVEALEKYLALMPKAKDADAVRQIVAQLRAEASAGKK